MRLTTTCLLGVLLIAGCADSSHESTPIEGQIGQNCTIYFRRDVLGMASDSPSSISTMEYNGAEVVQVGKLVTVTPNWIVINRNGSDLHIPQSSILMISVAKP